MKVLVVDDSLVIRTELKSILEVIGHEVITTASGTEAIKIYGLEKPDLVTMDVAMPIVNGITALRHIMEINMNAKVIMFTSHGFEDLVIESIQLGASGYILKPITMHKVESVINKVFKKDGETIEYEIPSLEDEEINIEDESKSNKKD